jgi:outer membrane protein TolC
MFCTPAFEPSTSRRLWRLRRARIASAVALTILLALFASFRVTAQTNVPVANEASLPAQPLSLIDCLNIAKDKNRSLREAKQELEIARGVVLQTRAILLPHLDATGSYQKFGVNTFDGNTLGLPLPNHFWNGSVRVVQSVFEGGRMISAGKSIKETTRQALNHYQTALNTVLRDVRIAYYKVLLAQTQQALLEGTLPVIEKQVAEAKQRQQAGTSLQLEVVQAEVELARLRPKLVMARNETRLSKIRLIDALGFNIPGQGGQDVRLDLSDSMQMQPVEVELDAAIRQALEHRPEIKALQSTLKLSVQDVVNAKAKNLPSVQVFGGYGGMNDPLDRNLYGWFAGAQMNWELFDGMENRGKARQAQATKDKNEIALENLKQQVEIEVRTDFSNLSAAHDVVESLRQAEAQAQEALRLTTVRSGAGTATQLQTLDANLALMETRTSAFEALYQYNSAVAQFEFATAANLPVN